MGMDIQMDPKLSGGWEKLGLGLGNGVLLVYFFGFLFFACLKRLEGLLSGCEPQSKQNSVAS